MVSALPSLLAASDFVRPRVDYHALAPELILAAGICLVLLVDLFVSEHRRWITSTIAGLVLLVAALPLVTLATSGNVDEHARSMFDGRYVVDNFSLIIKALFLLIGYLIVLMSTNEIEEGGYYEGEYYVLLLASVLGMVMMASARDLISVFVALELLSIPSYMLAAWRKRDSKSNEAGVKYYVLGVFASAVMLYGMSLLYGAANSTKLTEIGKTITATGRLAGVETLGIVFIIIGFGFKISAVPFHNWAPDTYEGTPTPVTAFFSVASKAAGFTALILMVFITFPQAKDVYQPLMWVLAVLTMTLGNLLALRQTNIVRMLAYSSISQGGFILMPLAVAGTNGAAGPALRAVMVYLIIYAATNLGAFAVIIAVSRKTHSGEISSFGGLFSYAPGLATLMTIFLASLAGIPPLGGWYAKFGVFRAVLDAGGPWGNSLAVIAAINTVIATAYYINVIREMWMKPVPDGDVTPIRVPGSLQAALAITGILTVVFGVLPGIISSYGNLTDLAGAFRQLTRDEVRRAIEEAGGQLRFDEFVRVALYGEHGFYNGGGGRAGRRGGHFLTSPEVGPLFGAVLARAIDGWWRQLGEPAEFTVVEVGAGPGTLARAIVAAEPESAPRYLAVEASAAQRANHPDEVESLAELPAGGLTGVVLANELLDNLPFRLAVFDGGWREAFVVADGDELREVLAVKLDPLPAWLPTSAPHGARVPIQDDAAAWVRTAMGALAAGRVVAIDYAVARSAELVVRPWREWLRTFRGHERGGHYLAEPGLQDVTADVCVDQLPPPDTVRTQAQFLALHGIDELVEEGRQQWKAMTMAPTVRSLMMRSRIREVEALTDPAGLGGFLALEWDVPSVRNGS